MVKKIGIIGYGNMGASIAQQLRSEYKILVFDKDYDKVQNVTELSMAYNAIDLVNNVELIVLAIKPQDFKAVFDEIKSSVDNKLVISIAAGITTSYIEKRLAKARVIRAMPNLALRVGLGMTCLCRGRSSIEQDLVFAQELFNRLGQTIILDESMIDAATAISGSGPGYFYYYAEDKNMEEIKNYAKDIFIPSLTSAAIKIGFTQEQAALLAEVTVRGSITFIEKTKILPSEAKKQVASKGGTTEAGLEALYRGGTLEDAVEAAFARSKELSRE